MARLIRTAQAQVKLIQEYGEKLLQHKGSTTFLGCQEEVQTNAQVVRKEFSEFSSPDGIVPNQYDK